MLSNNLSLDFRFFLKESGKRKKRNYSIRKFSRGLKILNGYEPLLREQKTRKAGKQDETSFEYSSPQCNDYHYSLYIFPHEGVHAALKIYTMNYCNLVMCTLTKVRSNGVNSISFAEKVAFREIQNLLEIPEERKIGRKKCAKQSGFDLNERRQLWPGRNVWSVDLNQPVPAGIHYQ